MTGTQQDPTSAPVPHHDGDDHPPPTAAEREILAAMNGIRRVLRAHRVASRASEKALGVSAAQLFVLQQLAALEAHHDAAPSIAALARLTATDASSVSVVVSRLAAHGLCERRHAEHDARRALVTITPAGADLLRRAPPTVDARMIAALRAMSAERRRDVVAGLEEVVQAMGADHLGEALFFEEGHDPHEAQA